MSKTLPFPQGGAGDGAPPPGPATPLPAGTEVAHLVIDRVLHEGPHNIVYLAHDGMADDLAGVVALMEYFPRALALRQPDGAVRARQAGDAIALSVAREAFVQDANALQRVQHPNVVHVLGSLQAHRTVYRAMAYVDGPTLERHVHAREGPARVGDIVRLTDALLDALHALHVTGLVHGNVRPDQILLAGGRIDRPVLLGMGSAAAEIAGHEPGPWAAPEQSAASRHDRIDSATDLYMLAATAWFAATGEEPPSLRDRLAHPDTWHPHEGLADLTEGPGDAPGTKARLARALAAALELLPASRPQRVDDLRGLLHPTPSRPDFEGSGSAPLWVGQVPDRESQWEVVEMAARGVPTAPRPAPLRSAHAEGASRNPPPATPQAGREAAAARRRPVKSAQDDPWGDATALAESRSLASRWAVLAVFAVGLLLAVAAWFVLRPASPLPVVVAPPSVPTAATASGAVSALPATPPAIVPSAPPMTEVATKPAPPTVSPSRATPRAPVPQALPPAARRDATTVASAVPPVARAAAPPSARPPAAAPCAKASGFALAYCLQEECAKPSNRAHPRCVEWRRSAEAAR